MDKYLIISFIAIFIPFTVSCKEADEISDIFKKRSPTPKDPRISPATDPEFYTFRDNFEDDYSIYTGQSINTDNIPINFGDAKAYNPIAVGVCLKWEWLGQVRWKEIIIDQTFWHAIDNDGKEVLIKHELGHCALDRNHDDKTYFGIQESLMHSQHIGSARYNISKEGYDKELYTQEKQTLWDDIEKYLRL